MRALRRFPGANIVAFMILALSISAATVTYSVVHHVALRPLSFEAPERLVAVYGSTLERPRDLLQSPIDYFAWHAATQSFDGLAAWVPTSRQIEMDGQRRSVRVVRATPDLFHVLRARPLVGTVFSPGHLPSGPDAVGVISHRLWQMQFAGAHDVVGRSLATNGGPVRVLGVMPRDFEFPVGNGTNADVWQPLRIPQADRTTGAAHGRSRYLRVIGRLRDGVTLEQARADVERVTAGLAAAHPARYANWAVRVGTLLGVLTEQVRPWMLMLLGAVGFVVLIACANVANLRLIQVSARQRDLAVRLSLGATRAQVAGGFLLEGLLLAGAATLAAVLLASWVLDVLTAAMPEDIPRLSAIALDARVLLTAAGLSLGTSIGFGLVPALYASRVPLATTLKDSGAGTATSTRRRWRAALLITEVALTSVLLVATALLVTSFARVTQAPLGFIREGLIGVRVLSVRSTEGSGAQRAHQFYLRADQALRGVPGVLSVARFSGAALPLQMGWSTANVSVPAAAATPRVRVEIRHVSPTYFEAAGIALLAGRAFSDTDDQHVVILDELAARQLFGAVDPIGKRVVLSNDEHVIVGLVGNAKFFGPEGTTQPQLYAPVESGAQSQGFLVRTRTPAGTLVPALRARLIELLPPGISAPGVDVIEETFWEMTADRRFNAIVMSVLGVLALLIAAGGIYGVTASIVAQQTREIGICIALGATKGRVVWGLALGTARLLAIGAALGLSSAWAASGILESLVFGVKPTDAVPYAISLLALIVVGLAASLVSAGRAWRIDPLRTLRSE